MPKLTNASLRNLGYCTKGPCALFHPVLPCSPKRARLHSCRFSTIFATQLKSHKPSSTIHSAPWKQHSHLPWIATRTITDDCRLCFQERDGTGFLACKRAHLAGYNSLLASLKMEPNPQSGDTMKRLEDAKETCLSTRSPNDQCYGKMQGVLQDTLQIYARLLDDYKNRYAAMQNRSSQPARIY